MSSEAIVRGPSPEGRVVAQHRLILNYLGSGRTLTPQDAMNVLGVSSLTKRVSELRRDGYPIASKWKRDAYGVRYKQYWLESALAPAQPNA